MNLWAAQMTAMADQIEAHDVGAYRSVVAAELRESAESPPDCEEGFMFRLCLILDWHPRLNANDLRVAVEQARKR